MIIIQVHQFLCLLKPKFIDLLLLILIFVFGKWWVELDMQAYRHLANVHFIEIT